MIPIPGFVLAFWLAQRYRERLRGRSGWRGKLGVFLDSIHINRLLVRRPQDHGPAVAGMTLFWIADAFAMWAALRAFGFSMNPAAMPFCFASLPTLRRMGEPGLPGAEEEADTDEPALRRKSA